jgi:O-Antigen ligase
VVLGAGTGLFFILAMERAGPAAALLPLVGLVAAYLISAPRIALAALLGLVVVVEADPVGLLPIGPSLYQPVRFGLTPPDLLLGILAAGTAFELVRTRSHPRGIGPMTLPLLAFACACVAGLVTGYFAEAPTNDLALSAVRFMHMLVLPFLVVNVLRDDASLRAFLGGAAVLAAFKAVTGLLAILSGAGFSVEGGTITFYEPLANWLLLLLLLTVLAARVRDVPLPGWVLWTVPLALAALLLSYRRSFWIAGLIAIVLVLVVGSRRRTRTVLAIGAVGALLALVMTLTVGQESPIVERARSLQPGELTSTRGDRYRVDEQRNVIAELRDRPITGLGMNVPWAAREPLSEEHDRNYTHVVLLWYWLKLGILGVITYIWLIATAMWTAFMVWRRQADGLIGAAGLAAAGGLVALVIVELTASFVGVEPRMTTAFGALLGWIGAAWHQLPQARRARATASTE